MGCAFYLPEDHNALIIMRGSPTWSNAEWIHVPT